MPAITPYELRDAILSAIEDSGCSGVLVSSARAHPRKFVVTLPDDSTTVLWVYAWTLTHGGRPSLPNEYRIQMTTVSSPLAFNPLGPTVLMGYEPSLRLFAGFDMQRHRTFTTGSPSVQIDINIVRNALQDGITLDRKSNDEIAIGIRPDQFVDYVSAAEHLHKYGAQPATFRLLQKATSLQDITEPDVAALAEPRRRIVQTVSRLSRKANFKQQVLQAYDRRCAVTRVQLRLVDAAHILPVGAVDSADVINNGLALSPTYHRAFDNGLIYLTENREMRINPVKMADLQALRLDGGIDMFKAPLGKILLPPDRAQWPKKDFIRRANAFRGIA